MSDNQPSGSESGARAPETPAATSSAPTAPAADLPATFGTGRGTGLARGRRKPAPAAPAASSAPASSGSYQPTAVQILTVESEYKNPFETGLPAETPAAETAAAAAPAPAPLPAPAPVAPKPAAAVESPAAPAPKPAPAPKAPVAATAPQPAPAPAAPVEAEPPVKAELNILPPANANRPAQSWEAPSFREATQNADRPIFRTSKRIAADANAAAAPESREPRDPSSRPPRRDRDRGPRPDRPARDSREPREPRPMPTPAPVPEPKLVKQESGGVIGWLKGLFSGGSSETTATPPRARASFRQPRRPGQSR